MKQQLLYLLQDLKRMVGRKKSRILFVWMSRGFAGIFLYRIDRGLFLTFGKTYQICRLLFLPIYNLLQAYSNLDIHYLADIKGGISILHPSMGVVISGKSIIGSNLTLTGGNIIGISKKCNQGDFIIGNNCNLGANAVVLGPIKIGDNINIGALACVTKDFLEANSTLIGVPAKIKNAYPN